MLFIHGTATDRSSWGTLTFLLRDRIRSITYDRRGYGLWPVSGGAGPETIEEHCDDAADLVRGLGPAPVAVCAASFGAVVALELMRTRPDLVRCAVLYEPAVSGMDGIPAVPNALIDGFRQQVGEGKGELAAELFQRRAIGDAVWERLPELARQQARSQWRAIWADLQAVDAFRARSPELGRIEVPILLLRGALSRKVFEPAFNALAAVLPNSRVHVIDGAHHHIVGPAWRPFADALVGFVAG